MTVLDQIELLEKLQVAFTRGLCTFTEYYFLLQKIKFQLYKI